MIGGGKEGKKKVGDGWKEGTKEGFLYSAYQMLGQAFTLGLFHIMATAKLEVSPIISIT